MTQPTLPLVFDATRHEIVWRPTRPELSISFIRGSSTRSGYHESYWNVTSRRPLSHDQLNQLAEMGFFSIGQAWHLKKSSEINDEISAVVVDRYTYQVVDLDLPQTRTQSYKYFQYEILRICDSGD